MPLEWPPRALTVSVHSSLLRRATEPMSRPAVAHQPFEIERGVGLAAFLDQRLAADRDRAAILLVAGQEDGDVGILQRSRGLHRAQRGEHHHHAALVVARAGPFAVIAAAGPVLERAVGLEHRVEMADQQQLLAASRACARRCGPTRLAALMSSHSTVKPERLEFGAHHLADRLRPRPAFSVPLFWLTSFSSSATCRACSASTVRDHPRFGGGERGGGGGGEQQSGERRSGNVSSPQPSGARRQFNRKRAKLFAVLFITIQVISCDSGGWHAGTIGQRNMISANWSTR